MACSWADTRHRGREGSLRDPPSKVAPRYGSIGTYVYHCKGDPQCRRTSKHYNDIPCPVDGQVKQRLLNSGIDRRWPAEANA